MTRQVSLGSRLAKTRSQFLETSTVGGLFTRAVSSESRISKSIWIILLVSGACWTAANFTYTVKHWLEFNSFTSMEIRARDKLEFPAVSICNKNPVHCGHLYDFLRECDEVLCVTTVEY